MIRVLVVVEGETEETIFRTLIGPALASRGVYAVARIVGKPGGKGGLPRHERLRGDVVRCLREDPNRFVSTLVDFYGRPADFPAHSPGTSTSERLQHAREAFFRDLARTEAEGARRFLPYLQMHEIEALLFSDPEKLAVAMARPTLLRELEDIRSNFATLEDINDSPATAPSKRLIALAPGYKKVITGANAAAAIGLERIRAACPLFDQWMSELLALPTNPFAPAD